jgi:hypothetical protein
LSKKSNQNTSARTHSLASGKAQIKSQVDDKEQSKLFIDKAREIGADEKHSAADKLMARLAAKKPEPRRGDKS